MRLKTKDRWLLKEFFFQKNRNLGLAGVPNQSLSSSEPWGTSSLAQSLIADMTVPYASCLCHVTVLVSAQRVNFRWYVASDP